MPINVEINETQAQSNEVKVGQFRTDGEGSYGIVVEGDEGGCNFVVIADRNFSGDEIPYVNYGLHFGGDASASIKRDFPFIAEGRITIEGYRK